MTQRCNLEFSFMNQPLNSDISFHSAEEVGYFEAFAAMWIASQTEANGGA